jgi:hypothetical protein
MNGQYRVIDETNYSVLETFGSRGEAIDFVAALRSVNDDDYLDELTIANETRPVLHGDSLREALRRRDEARLRNSRDGNDERLVETMAAKGDAP